MLYDAREAALQTRLANDPDFSAAVDSMLVAMGLAAREEQTGHVVVSSE